MAAKFELYLDKKGEFRFRLKAGNGRVIATVRVHDEEGVSERHRVDPEERG